MGLRRLEYSAEGKVPPERFIRALTDFSEDRPKYWPGQTRNQYKLLELGDDWALVREGTLTGWEQSRYDWSKPGTVISTVEKSNFLHPGTTWEFRVKKIPGGCHVDAALTRNFKGFQGHLLQLGFGLPGTRAAFALVLQRTLDILEREAGKGD